MIDELNKILSNYSCKIITTGTKEPVVITKLKNVKIDDNQTVANTEKYLKSILKTNIKIIGLIYQNIPNYKKLNELNSYQKKIYSQTDLEKKLNTLISLSKNSLNYDEDLIIKSMSIIYLKITNEEEKELFKKFLKELKINNLQLHNKVYSLFLAKFPKAINWIK